MRYRVKVTQTRETVIPVNAPNEAMATKLALMPKYHVYDWLTTYSHAAVEEEIPMQPQKGEAAILSIIAAGDGRMDALIVRDLLTNLTFTLSDGFTDDQRRFFWREKRFWEEGGTKPIVARYTYSGWDTPSKRPILPMFTGLKYRASEAPYPRGERCDT